MDRDWRVEVTLRYLSKDEKKRRSDDEDAEEDDSDIHRAFRYLSARPYLSLHQHHPQGNVRLTESSVMIRDFDPKKRILYCLFEDEEQGYAPLGAIWSSMIPHISTNLHGERIFARKHLSLPLLLETEHQPASTKRKYPEITPLYPKFYRGDIFTIDNDDVRAASRLWKLLLHHGDEIDSKEDDVSFGALFRKVSNSKDSHLQKWYLSLETELFQRRLEYASLEVLLKDPDFIPYGETLVRWQSVIDLGVKDISTLNLSKGFIRFKDSRESIRWMATAHFTTLLEQQLIPKENAAATTPFWLSRVKKAISPVPGELIPWLRDSCEQLLERISQGEMEQILREEREEQQSSSTTHHHQQRIIPIGPPQVIDDIEDLFQHHQSKQQLPPCTRMLLAKLRKNKHLKHEERRGLSGMLLDIGVPGQRVLNYMSNHWDRSGFEKQYVGLIRTSGQKLYKDYDGNENTMIGCAPMAKRARDGKTDSAYCPFQRAALMETKEQQIEALRMAYDEESEVERAVEMLNQKKQRNLSGAKLCRYTCASLAYDRNLVPSFHDSVRGYYERCKKEIS